MDPVYQDPENQKTEDRTMDFRCDKCNEVISKKVWDYSIEHYDRPLCYKCQKIVSGEQKDGRQ